MVSGIFVVHTEPCSTSNSSPLLLAMWRSAVDRETRQMWLSQESYLSTFAARFRLNLEGEATRIPYGAALELVPSTGIAGVKDIARYQAKIGSIRYTAVITRPYIAYHASKLAQFSLNPDDIHQKVLDQVIQYAYNTRRLAIHFTGAPERRQGYCTTDAS